MKKTKSTTKSLPAHDETMREDYSDIMIKENRKPNRFAGKMHNARRFLVHDDGTRYELRTIELDEDVAQLFPTSESINAVLRAIAHALPPQLQR